MRFLQLGLLFVGACAAARQPSPHPGAAAPPGRTPGEPSSPALTSAQVTTTQGRITGYTTTPAGDMDGLILDSGVTIHFPPHAGRALLPLVQQREVVRVDGWETTGPTGRVIEASRVTSPTSGATVDVSALPAPPRLRPTPPEGAAPR
jgi:hypothetical protein